MGALPTVGNVPVCWMLPMVLVVPGALHRPDATGQEELLDVRSEVPERRRLEVRDSEPPGSVAIPVARKVYRNVSRNAVNAIPAGSSGPPRGPMGARDTGPARALWVMHEEAFVSSRCASGGQQPFLQEQPRRGFQRKRTIRSQSHLLAR